MLKHSVAFAKWNLCGILCAWALGIANPAAAANAVVYWDTNGATAGVGGTGSWDATSTNWNVLATGSGATIVYANTATSMSALFNGTAGTATIATGNTIHANFTNFGANGFTIAGADATAILNLDGTAPTITTAGGNTQTISATISGTAGLEKFGSGTLILSGANTFTGGLIIGVAAAASGNGGTLLLDYSNNATVVNTGNNVTAGGGILYIKGKNSGTTAQTLGNYTMISNSGLNTVVVDKNGGAGTTLTMGNTWVRAGGSAMLVDLSLGGTLTSSPTVTDGIVVGSGAVAGFLVKTSSRVDFALVAAGNIGTANAATALPASGSTSTVNYLLTGNQTVTATESVGTLRVDTTGGGSLTLSGANITLTHNAMIFDGTGDYTLTGSGSLGTTATIINQFSTGKVTINSQVATGNQAVSKFGTGLLDMNNSNTSTNTLQILSGVYRASSANALFTGLNTLNGGVIELTSGSGDFTKALGTAAGQLQFLGDGGFSAFGGTRVVNFGGAAATVQWAPGAIGFIPNNNTLLLSSPYSDSTVDFRNPIDLNGATRVVFVDNGSATVDALFSGVLSNSSATNPAGLTKTGAGRLEMSAASTYDDTTTVSAGVLSGTGTLSKSALVIKSGAAVAPGLAATAGTFTAAGADFSSGGALNIRAQAPAAVDKLTLTNSGSTAALTMGGSSVLNIDLTGFAGSGEFVIAQANSWSVGSGFKNVNILNKPASVTNVQVSYLSANSTTKQVLLSIDSTVSPVTVEGFTARVDGVGVLLSWNCLSEYQNAGFNAYRCAEGGDWTRVNPSLIPGRITNPDAQRYELYDWAPPGRYEYKLESVAVSGQREAIFADGGGVNVDWSSPTEVSLGVLDSAEQSLVVAASVRNAELINAQFANGRGDISVAEAAVLAVGEKRVAASASFVSSPVASSASARWFSGEPISTATAFAAAKVVCEKRGVLFIPQAMLPSGFSAGSVAIQREGRNVQALALVNGGLLVYAPGYEDDYTNKDALFLRAANAPTQAGLVTAAAGLFDSSMPVNVSTPATSALDFHDVYFDFNLRPFTFAPWFSAKYLTPGTAQEFTLNLPQASGGAATLTINLWSLTESHHALQVLVNSVPVGEAAWDVGGRMIQLSINVPSGVLNAGDNVVSLATPPGDGTDTQPSLLYALSASYTRLLDGSKPFEITNTSATAQLFELHNVPSATTWVVDTRFTDRAALVPNQTQLDADGTHRVRFVASAGGTYLVVPAGQEQTPLSVTKRSVAPLRLKGSYLATGPAQFSSGVQALLLKHAKDGLRGAFVDQEQLFDYYNFGRYGPAAIQNAVRATKPQFLLLLGRTTYDYKNYSGLGVDPLCPAFLVPTSFWAQATSDSLFGDLGRGIPEVAVGRLPVNNPSELSAAVNHILTYAGAPLSGARLHAVADMLDPGAGNFGQQLGDLAQSHPDLAWQTNTLGETYQTAPEVNAALSGAANGGADFIIYNGHGNSVRLGKSAPRILDTDSVGNWRGNVVFLQSTCTANWMAKDETGFKSIAIQAMTQPQGGISAGIGTSTYMNADVAIAFMNQLLKSTGTNARWGTALLKAQQWAATQPGAGFYGDLMKTEQLFGDPAMRIYAPPQRRVAPPDSGVDMENF